MLSIAPQFAWLLDDHEQSENNYLFSGESISPSSQPKNGDAQGGNKKLNHNASERDRRKKINNLYTTLRSLLPPEDQSKKLSIPNTISRVLKYIPELQTEVDRLVRRRESFKSKAHDDGFKTITNQFSASVVSATQISNEEIIIQISVPKVAKTAVSEAIMILEQEGFIVLTSYSSQSSRMGRIFCNLHLQGQGLDAEMLKEKLWSIYGSADEVAVLTTSFGS